MLTKRATSALATLLLASDLSAAATIAHNSKCEKGTPVSVRLPPAIHNISYPSWTPPPTGWDLGYWFQTNSSSDNSFQRNLEYSTEALDASDLAGARTDLASFQVDGGDTVYSSYGEDTPTDEPAVYHYAGTGILEGASDVLSVLAWGLDCRGAGYRISHSTYTEFTKTPESLDVLSRSPLGPDAATLENIRSALTEAGDKGIAALAAAMVPARRDNGRDGMPPLDKCDDYCKSNKNLEGLLG